MPKEKKGQAPTLEPTSAKTTKTTKSTATRKTATKPASKTTSAKAVSKPKKASPKKSPAQGEAELASMVATLDTVIPAAVVAEVKDVEAAPAATAKTSPKKAATKKASAKATEATPSKQGRSSKAKTPAEPVTVTETPLVSEVTAEAVTKAETLPAQPAKRSRKASTTKASATKANADDIAAPETASAEASAAAPKPKRASKGKGKKAVEPAPEAAVEDAPAPKKAATKRKAAAKPKTSAKAKKAEVAQETTPSEPAASEVMEAAPIVVATTTPPAEQHADAQAGALPLAAETVEESARAEVTAPSPQQASATDAERIELVTSQLRKMGRPVHIRDFERSFTRVGREKLGRDLSRLLEDLTRSGEVIRTRRNTYGLPEAMNLVRGRFQASASGFGFVIPDSGGDDFYIREGETLEAWNGDIVFVRPEGGRFDRSERRSRSRQDSSPRAAVVRIVSRAYSRLVGSLEYLKGYAFLKPDDHRARHRIMLVQDGTQELPAGSRLVTQLFWPEDTGEDEVYGEVVQVLGAEDDPTTETQAVIVKYGLHNEFPEEVVTEAQRIPSKVPARAFKGRLDLREYNIFTVDGSDAKDFDDAIHIQSTPEGHFVVGIHIADVAHYVTPDSALDREAYDRATSVYLPGSVLPMLPEHLSNGVCSLVPYEDRLTMSALIELSGDGDLLGATFTPSVIRSKARLTYDEVQAYSEASATLPEHARALEGDLHLLLKITAKLRQKRLREGSLDFKMREVKVDIGKDGHMQLIPLHEETARGMIEDLMLLANKAVAHFLLEKNVPTLYRIHEEPTLGRFQEASAAIGRMGLSFPGGEPTPQAYQAVLKGVRGTPQESVVNTVLLRSMQQAKYAEENLGHFGLAFDEYLHFTSPIRRYPDLLVHRALKLALQGEVSDRTRAELAAPLAEQSRHTSERERNAAEAERDLTKYYQAKWAQEHLQETFEGRVSGVIASGLFVMLENGVEGRLHISNLDDDYYVFIEEASILKGRSSGRSYRIGDTIQVSISKVNPLARQIDFAQENSMEGSDHKPRARRREDREAQKREKLSSFLPKPNSATPEAATPTENASRSGGYQRQSRPERPDQRRSQSRPQAERYERRDERSSTSAGSSYRRRVVTLDRPRNEHLRPVNITVQRMYFGDWTVENMPADEGRSEARPGRERGYDRSERRDMGRGSSRYTRGGSDRGAVSNLNGGTGSRSERQSEGAERTAESDEAKRRRRRRGRRPGGASEG